jgi:hypothetical protein
MPFNFIHFRSTTAMSFIIRLQNLSRVAKSSDVRAFFSALSIPGGSVCIVGGDSGEAYIGFSTDEDARQAMLRDGLVLCQNRVKLTFSSRKEMEQAMERAQQMSNVVKNVEKVIHPNSMINTPSIQAGQSGLMPSNLSGPNFNQGIILVRVKNFPEQKCRKFGQIVQSIVRNYSAH